MFLEKYTDKRLTRFFFLLFKFIFGDFPMVSICISACTLPFRRVTVTMWLRPWALRCGVGASIYQETMTQ